MSEEREASARKVLMQHGIVEGFGEPHKEGYAAVVNPDAVIAAMLAFAALPSATQPPERGAVEVVARTAVLREREGMLSACQSMADDFQVSETHHPAHVLVAAAAFDEMRVRLRTLRIAEMHESSGGRAQTLKSVTTDDTPHWQAVEPEAAALSTPATNQAGEVEREQEEVEIADEAVNFVFDALSKNLGLAEWQVVEGSEDWHGDVSATLYRLLIDAGIIDEETGAIAALAAAPHAEREDGK